MKRHSPPDIDLLKSALNFDPQTGIFTWKRQLASNCIIGHEAGYINSCGYRDISLNGVAYKAHRLAWFITYGTWPDLIDHIDTDKANNAISNLREATTSENSRNQSTNSRNISGSRGVSWHSRTRKWRVKIRRDGIEYYGGSYRSLADAKKASESLCRELHGEFYREIKRQEVK